MATDTFLNAPITYLINEVGNLIESATIVAATNITNTITPLVSICFGIYILMLLVSMLSDTGGLLNVSDWIKRIVSWALIIGIGLSAENITNILIPIVSELGNDLANAATGGTVNENTLDKLTLHYIDIIGQSAQEVAQMDFTDSMIQGVILNMKIFIILIGLVPFLVVATCLYLIAKIGALLVLSVAPIFFAFLLFPATRQYFSAWLNSVISLALIPVFIAMISLISVNISFKIMGGDTGLLDTSMTTVILASIANLILMGMLKWVSMLASSLSNGGVNLGSVNPLSSVGGISKTLSYSKREASGMLSGMQSGAAKLSRLRGKGGNIKAG